MSVSVLSSHYVHADNIHFYIRNCVPPFWKELYTWLTVCVLHLICLFVFSVIYRFGFEGSVLVLSVPVPYSVSFIFPGISRRLCFGPVFDF